MCERVREAVPAVPPRGLVTRVGLRFPAKPPEVTRALVDTIATYPWFVRACRQGRALPVIRRWFFEIPRMADSLWSVPSIPTIGDLAEWLRLSVADLGWLADPHGLERVADDPPLRNYLYRWVAKPSGGLRLLEAPKSRLKEAQRRVLHGILDAIPPHPAAHGFRRGHSIVTNAAPHVGAAVVTRLDLEDFFASIGSASVLGVFLTAGYPRAVAQVLTALCTNRLSRALLAERPAGGDTAARWRQARRLDQAHLPSGAPTSPALANLCAWGLDVRLAAAAASADLAYTRYADDLTFSGGPRARRFLSFAAEIVREEGFHVHLGKTRIMGRGARQEVTGVVVNVRPGIARARYDELRALLHNCVVHGPASQDRVGGRDFRAHLEGTVASVRAIDPHRGARLERILLEITWGAP